jgi:hypothetical protein
MKIVLLWGDNKKQMVTHFRECCGDSSQYTPAGDKLDNTTYVWSLGPYVWQQFTQQSRSRSRAHLSVVHVFYVIHLRAIRGWLIHYPSLHHCRNGGVSSDSATISATKFTRLHKSYMRQYCSKLAHRGQIMRSLIDTGRGYHIQSSEHENTPLSILPIWHSPLSPTYPIWSQIKAAFRSLKENQS